MHVHFRSGDMLKAVVPLTTQTFAGALVMPNTNPPIASAGQVLDYRSEIMKVADPSFQPYFTLYFSTEMTRDFLASVRTYIQAIKFYPKGMTTNSDHGCDPRDPKIMNVLGHMQELGIPLCVHGEDFGFVMDRELFFGAFYRIWAETFPKLKIIMEHITAECSTELLRKHENLYATITVHHLLITLDDVIGGLLDPHLFCKPVAKRDDDLRALLHLALDGHPKVMLGTDSAPHPVNKKESACGCAGVFTAPIALQLLAELFAKKNCLSKLQDFVSNNARAIYGIDPPKKTVTLVKEPFTIPEKYGDVVPMWAGRKLEWSIQAGS